MPNYIDRDRISIAGIPVMSDEAGECYVRVDDVRQAILQVPIAEMKEEKHSTWEIFIQRDGESFHAVCKKCGFWWIDNTNDNVMYYCPHCGAKMDAVEKNIH